MADTCCLDRQITPYKRRRCSHALLHQSPVAHGKRRLQALHDPLRPARRVKHNLPADSDACLPSEGHSIPVNQPGNINILDDDAPNLSTHPGHQAMEVLQRSRTHPPDVVQTRLSGNHSQAYNSHTPLPAPDQSNAQSSARTPSPSSELTYAALPPISDLVPQPLPSPAAITFARAIITSIPSSRPIIDSSYHHNAWPVDDSRHCYDFADFMEQWRQRSESHSGEIPFNLGKRNVLEGCQETLDSPVSPASLSSTIDMQGIVWADPAPAREEALVARRMLHPLYAPALRPSPEQNFHRALSRQAETPYLFRNYCSQHRAKFSHHQLRSLLAASSRHDVFYAADGKIQQTSLSCPGLSRTVAHCSKPPENSGGFKVTCLAALPPNPHSDYSSDNVLLVGGFRGEYALLDLTDPNQMRYNDGAINSVQNGLVTHVHGFYHRQSGLPQAAFCSNDGNLRLMDVRTRRIQNVFSYNDPVNCAVTSLDGRLRVLVGDSKDTFITDADSGETLVTLRQHTDYGFSCAWSPDGRYVATGSEDNCVVLWDARHWKKPVAVQPTIMSCPRSLHFTHSGALVVAEEEDTVSIYSSGGLDTKQDLRFFGSIAGVALIDGGDEIVVANCDRTVGGLLSFEKRRSGSNSLADYRRKSRRRDR